MRKLPFRAPLNGFAALILLLLLSEIAFAQDLPAQSWWKKKEPVSIPVLLDRVEVYRAVAGDSAAARAEVARVENILAELRAHAGEPERIRLRERDLAGILLLDNTEVLAVKMENRAYPELSPLANALALREQVLAAAPRLPAEARSGEEELLLRLLLGIIYPVLLLVVLRMTRFGLYKWERNWRKAALQWMIRFAGRSGLSARDIQARRIISLLSGIERLVVYSLVTILISFAWFALFPQTQALAKDVLNAVIGPALSIIGGTAWALVLILYTLAVFFFTYWLTRQLSRRRSQNTLPGILKDPLVYFVLRIGLWILALFLVLFPYPGVPRLFAVGLLFLSLLAALIALRPLIEEIASGIYFNNIYSLKPGDRLTVDGVPYQVQKPGLIHLRVLRDKKKHWLPYSKILKADLTMSEKSRGKKA